MLLAFAHITKTGGKTFNRMLRRSFGTAHADVEGRLDWPWPYSIEDHRETLKIYQSLRSIAGHKIMPSYDLESEAGPILYFTFLRDPIKRAAHYYQVRRNSGRIMPFEHWVQHSLFGNQMTRHLAGELSVAKALEVIEAKRVVVGLVEHYDTSLMLVKSRFGESGLNLRYEANIATDLSINVLVDKAKVALMEQANRHDLELYRRVREEVWPRQLLAYPGDLDADLAAFQASNGVDGTSWSEQANRLKRNLVYKPRLRRKGVHF